MFRKRINVILKGLSGSIALKKARLFYCGTITSLKCTFKVNSKKRPLKYYKSRVKIKCREHEYNPHLSLFLFKL